MGASSKVVVPPPQISALYIAAYRGPRFFSMSSIVTGPVFATTGVIAGCSMATTFVRVFIIPSLDLLSPSVSRSLDVYIDDYGLKFTAARSHIVGLAVEGARELRSLLTEDMQRKISLDKAAVVA